MFIHIYLDITLRASMTNVEKKITSFSVVENESIVYITERRERKKFSIPIACISFFFFPYLYPIYLQILQVKSHPNCRITCYITENSNVNVEIGICRNDFRDNPRTTISYVTISR